MLKKILVSQPRPTSEKSPYFDLEKKHGITVDFHPFIKVEGLSSKEFRQQKISIDQYTAVIFTAKTAIDHYFRLAKELRFDVPDTMKYFCISESVAFYLQKYIVYRKRKIFYSETGKADGLMPLIEKHKKESYLYIVSDQHESKLPGLEDKGLTVQRAVMYRTVNNEFDKEKPFDYDALVFFTPAGIKSLLANFPDFEQGDIALGAMGKNTIDEIKNLGLRLDITTTPEAPSIPAAIDRYITEQKKKK